MKGLYQEENGHWYFRKMINGKRWDGPLDTTSKRDAEAIAKRFVTTAKANGIDAAVAQLKHGKAPIDRASPTVDDMLALYDAYCRDHAGAGAPRKITSDQNKSHFKRLCKTLKVTRVSGLTTRVLTENRAKQIEAGKSPFTLKSEYASAKSLFKKDCLNYYRDIHNVTLSNPFDGISLVAQKKSRRYLPISEENRQKMIEGAKSLPPIQRIIFILAFNYGLRRREIDNVALNWFQKEGDVWVMTVGGKNEFEAKKYNSRDLELSETKYNELLALRKAIVKDLPEETRKKREAQEWLIPIKPRNRQPKTIRTQKHINDLSAWLKQFGVEGIHQLRKEFGSWIVDTHNSIELAAELLGDKTYQLVYDTYSGRLKRTSIADRD